MKKIKLFFCMMAVVVLTTCVEKKITVKGADGTEYESYQECCAAQDFQAAHQFLARMKNASAEKEDYYEKKEFEKKYEEAKEEVFKQEALYLMGIGDEQAKKRILYLLKEGGNDEHISMLIDLAMENGDADFVKSLMRQYTKEIGDEDFEKLIKFFVEKQDEEYFFKLLTDIENKIPNRPALGLVKSNYYGSLDDSYENFIKNVKKYNNACRAILNGAIASKNQSLAQRVIKKPKSTLACKVLGDWCRVVEKEYSHSSVYKAFKVTLDNSDANSIKAAYQEAVSNSAFK